MYLFTLFCRTFLLSFFHSFNNSFTQFIRSSIYLFIQSDTDPHITSHNQPFCPSIPLLKCHKCRTRPFLIGRSETSWTLGQSIFVSVQINFYVHVCLIHIYIIVNIFYLFFDSVYMNDILSTFFVALKTFYAV